VLHVIILTCAEGAALASLPRRRQGSFTQAR